LLNYFKTDKERELLQSIFTSPWISEGTYVFKTIDYLKNIHHEALINSLNKLKNLLNELESPNKEKSFVLLFTHLLTNHGDFTSYQEQYKNFVVSNENGEWNTLVTFNDNATPNEFVVFARHVIGMSTQLRNVFIASINIQNRNMLATLQPDQARKLLALFSDNPAYFKYNIDTMLPYVYLVGITENLKKLFAITKNGVPLILARDIGLLLLSPAQIRQDLALVCISNPFVFGRLKFLQQSLPLYLDTVITGKAPQAEIDIFLALLQGPDNWFYPTYEALKSSQRATVSVTFGERELPQNTLLKKISSKIKENHYIYTMIPIYPFLSLLADREYIPKTYYTIFEYYNLIAQLEDSRIDTLYVKLAHKMISYDALLPPTEKLQRLKDLFEENVFEQNPKTPPDKHTVYNCLTSLFDELPEPQRWLKLFEPKQATPKTLVNRQSPTISTSPKI